MASARTLYLTQSKHGIWYYQRWIPINFRKKNPNLKSIFRVSLRTKNKQDASRLSRLYSVKIDDLALQYFDSPEQFGEAMELLSKSAKIQNEYPDSFQGYEEHFLSAIDGREEWLLSKAEKFSSTFTDKLQKLREEISFLKQALLNGNPIGTKQDQRELISAIEEVLHPTLSDEQNPTIEELFEKWKEAAYKGNKTKRTIDETYTPAIEFFIRVINNYNGGSVKINSLSAQHIHHYQKTYSAIPSRTKTRNISIEELIQLKGASKSAKTINDNFTNIGTFLKWISVKAYPIDLMLQQILTQGSDIKLDDKTKKQRQPLTDIDLKHLFNSDKYTKTGDFKTSAMYWAPLIAIFTGARMSEILQLEKHDIKKSDKAYIFNFDDIDHKTKDEYKHIKKDGSRREVPIHKQLLRLGFIDYVNSVKDSLFPDEPRNKSNGRFDAFQKRFVTYRKQVGVIPEHKMVMKDFHSIRHTVETKLNEIRTTGRATQRFDEGIVDAIIGHSSSSRSIGQKTYNHSQYISAKNTALNRLEYGSIDFSTIMLWNKCKFSRKPYREKAASKLSNA